MKAHQLGDVELLKRYELFFSGTVVLPMSPAVFDHAAELRARHRIRTPDALRLAAAIEHGCDEFWTNDDRLASTDALIRIRVFK